jgi:ArsR family transcriptional regulator
MKISEQEKRTLQLFSLLSNSTRLMIVKILQRGEANVSKMVRLTNKRQPVISQHLRLLRNLDIVSFSTHDQKVYYSLKKREVIDLIDKAMQIMKRTKKK